MKIEINSCLCEYLGGFATLKWSTSHSSRQTSEALRLNKTQAIISLGDFHWIAIKSSESYWGSLCPSFISTVCKVSPLWVEMLLTITRTLFALLGLKILIPLGECVDHTHTHTLGDMDPSHLFLQCGKFRPERSEETAKFLSRSSFLFSHTFHMASQWPHS